MQLTQFAAITIPDAQEMTESLTMMGTGFVVVMSVLCFLWLSISIIGKFFVVVQERALKKKEALGVTNAHTSPADESGESISPVTLALISAAVQTTLDGSYRIVDIERSSSSESTAK
ncbi:MAG: OadG family transporter subunit [Verrucomicrobiota bacterium]